MSVTLAPRGAHGGERLVAGGVDEGDRTTVDRDLRGTDGLGDAAGLARGDAGVTDGVEKRRLAVVDVAHDGDHGRTRLEVLRVVIEAEGVLLLLAHDLDVAVEVVGDDLDEVVRHGLGKRERGSQEEEALDDVVGGHAEKLGELLDRGALRDLDHIELREVLVVCDGGVDALLLGCLLGLLDPTLLTAPAASGGFARCLLDGFAGLVEHVASAVDLGLSSHATVAILLVAAASCALLALARTAIRIVGGGLLLLLLGGGRRGWLLLRRAGLSLLALGDGATVALALRLLLGGLFRLLLQDLLLLSNLVEQACEGLGGLGCGVLHAVALSLLGGRLLGGDALLLGLLARGLGDRTLALLLRTLLLAAPLGLYAVFLGLLGGDARLFGDGLLLGPLGCLDLGRACVEEGLELLAHDGDVGVLERGRRRLGRNLHLSEVIEHLLARHAIFLGKVMNASLCHVTNLPKFGLAPR